jgi:hypothetical protein
MASRLLSSRAPYAPGTGRGGSTRSRASGGVPSYHIEDFWDGRNDHGQHFLQTSTARYSLKAQGAENARTAHPRTPSSPGPTENQPCQDVIERPGQEYSRDKIDVNTARWDFLLVEACFGSQDDFRTEHIQFDFPLVTS